jgi:hypothetical protein
MSKVTVKRGIILIVCLIFQPLTLFAEFSGGTGEPNDPYQIATADDLILLGNSPEYYDKHFILTADIDLDPNLPGRKVFSKAVIALDTSTPESIFPGKPFTGVFDGSGYTISNLKITGVEYLGLFGGLETGGKISNLGLVAVDVNGTGDYVGGLVGTNYEGSIISCYSTGKVSGDKRVGGLVGLNIGDMTACYSTCVVIGGSYVGGLVGRNTGSIATGYSTGAVTGNEDVGGLVGDNYGHIISGLWDVETSGQDTSADGTGLTTAEMGEISTFLNAGWDFVDENVNGTCDYWQISPGDYPRLRSHSGDNPEILEGLGTAEQPYLIRDTEDLGAIWYKPMAHYRLEESVDLSGIMWSMAVIPWFGGTFDGNGYEISNLHIQGGGYLGLFGQMGSGANISNLGIKAVDVNGTGYYVGALVGYNYKGSIIESYSTGTVTGDDRIGGLVGENWRGSITSSYSTVTVSGDRSIGGLVGYNLRGTVEICFSTGTITGTGEEVGGLVGDNVFGSITTSYSTGSVMGTGEKVGGLVGANYYGGIISSYNSGTITGTGAAVGGLVGYIYESSIAASYNMGTVTGISEQVGGLVGYNWRSSITTSYSTGTVSGDKDVGGLLGYNDDGSITASYNTGEVTGNEHTGGLVGYKGLVGFTDYGVVITSFWDRETSGQDTSAGGTGLTTGEMQEISTFLNAGWDFVDENLNGTCDYWQMSPGDYPKLRSHSSDSPEMPEGLGTAGQPYLIRDAGDLGAIWYKPMAHYRLEASLDLSGITWSMAVVPWFGGTFDGNGYEISNLHIHGGGYLGLFGQSGSGAIISNLDIKAIDVNGTDNYVGALVGYNNSGDIAKSFSTGTVMGTGYYTGGLVGLNLDGSVTSSYSAATVSGNNRVGGLVGENFRGSIDTCFSTGIVTGTDHNVGGLVGENGGDGNIISSYNTGTVIGNYDTGGLVGFNIVEGNITSCYNTGTITGVQATGGLVGYNIAGSIISSYNTGTITGTYTTGGLVGRHQGSGSITSSYNSGAVSGDEDVGGIVGSNSESNVTTSYNRGTVTGINDHVGGLVGENYRSNITMSYSSGTVTGRGSKVGGLVGENDNDRYNSIAATFWDMETSGQPSSAGGTGKTTAEMQTAGTFIDAGWDFVDETENGTEDIWCILEGQDYPRLWWELIE